MSIHTNHQFKNHFMYYSFVEKIQFHLKGSVVVFAVVLPFAKTVRKLISLHLTDGQI